MTGGGSSCGACKFLRRRCIPDCMFKPYFSYERSAAHFAAVHKVFGASNASKMLLHLPVHSRGDAAAMICYEAIARVQDPVYGCVAHIFALQHQVAMLEEEIENIEKQMAETSGFHAAAPFSVDQLLLSADASVNLACCSNVEMQRDLGLESSDFENLLQELSEDYYLEHHE